MFFANAGAKIVQGERKNKYLSDFLRAAAYFPSFTEANLAFATPNLSMRSSCIGR